MNQQKTEEKNPTFCVAPATGNALKQQRQQKGDKETPATFRIPQTIENTLKQQQRQDGEEIDADIADNAQLTKLFLVIRTSMRHCDLDRALKNVVFSIDSMPIYVLGFDLVFIRLQCAEISNRKTFHWHDDTADGCPRTIYMPLLLCGEFSIALLNAFLKENAVDVSIECVKDALAETEFDMYVELFKNNALQAIRLDRKLLNETKQS